MEYLSKADILFINQKPLAKHGGNFVPPANLLNEAPLDYVVEAVQAEMFGQPLYPEIYQQAGVYMFNIISNHVFSDGNKRTGLASALLFLKLNGYRLHKRLKKLTVNVDTEVPAQGVTTSEVLTNFTLDLAAGQIALETCQAWFKENFMPLK